MVIIYRRDSTPMFIWISLAFFIFSTQLWAAISDEHFKVANPIDVERNSFNESTAGSLHTIVNSAIARKKRDVYYKIDGVETCQIATGNFTRSSLGCYEIQPNHTNLG